MPQPKYRDMSWEQLEGSTRRALRWLNACTLLSKHDLLAVAFPPGHDRRRVDHALRIWQREAFVATIDDSDIYRLGEHGAAKLRNAGIDLRFDGNDPAYRVRTGLLLAGQFAVELALDLAQDANITHFTWSAAPFSGDGPRADGVGELWYATVRRADHDMIALNLLDLTSPTAPASGQVGMQLLLEIDLSTETEPQLERRAERWRTRLRDHRAHLAPNCWPYVLWVTDGGWERANTIWRAWIRKAGLPHFITTTAALHIEGRWRPWRAAWRDEHGRPRTLNPHASWEPLWRFQASPPPQYTSLEQAIKAWDATQHI
jgi:hypothetical protein